MSHPIGWCWYETVFAVGETRCETCCTDSGGSEWSADNLPRKDRESRRTFTWQSTIDILSRSALLGTDFTTFNFLLHTHQHFSRLYCFTQYDPLLASYCRLSVCLSVTPCTVAKRYIVQRKCLNNGVGSALHAPLSLNLPTSWTKHVGAIWRIN